MDPHSFVYSAVLLLVVASVAVAVFRHFGLGSILGLLVTGIIVGPHTPGPFVTAEVDGVRQFTELGVVLLLFLIGLEMKPRRLWDMRRMLFGLGSLQVALSALAIAIYFKLDDLAWPAALLIGAGFALSSTAFVMQILRDQGDIASRHGQTAFAILLMQDLAVVPLLALIPLFVDSGPLPQGHVLLTKVATVASMLTLVVLGGRYVVPRVLDFLARKNNREGFFLVALAAMFLAAMLMDQAGMSMALGAFLMGVMLSTSRYSLQIEATIEPHKGMLMSLFFVAVGMSINVGTLLQHPLEFALHVLVVIAIKIAILYGLCVLFGTGQATAIRTAFMLSQGGEFGFVVFGAARATGVIDDQLFAIAVAVISLTMLTTPMLSKLGNHLSQRLKDDSDAVHDHFSFGGESAHTRPRVVIAGYGRVGHTIGTILAQSQIPFVAFETNAALVAKWRHEGHPVYYGDVANPELLGNAALQGVDLVVLTIDDSPMAIKTATLIRAHAPSMTIIARARDLASCDALRRAGVRDAFPETLEASLLLAKESLQALGISADDAGMLLDDVRRGNYALVRSGPEATSQT